VEVVEAAAVEEVAALRPVEPRRLLPKSPRSAVSR
jgi:hypothetical protein